jgi:hypothetical protein
MKKTILIDLDGVLNTYTGNFDKDFIPPIKEGAFDFLKNLSEEYQIKLFTTRNKILASKWISENKLDGFIEDITNIKELSYLYIDDRCINFNGNYDDLTDKIINFKAWYKN